MFPTLPLFAGVSEQFFDGEVHAALSVYDYTDAGQPRR